MRLVRCCLLVAFALSTRADVFFDVPIVTQVQGAAFYRTSLAISNVGPTSLLALNFIYRSPVDNTMQSPAAALTLTTGTAFSTDDIVQLMKTSSTMRAADKTVALFGSMLIELTAVTDPSDVTIIARTYSPGPGGNGTMGIAYAGRPTSTTRAYTRLTTTVRNGAFGSDGNARANIGFVNLANAPIDLKVQYVDAATGAILKTFTLSTVIGHPLESREVVQLGNIFADPAISSVSRVIVVAFLIDQTVSFSGYAVQLDNTTNDGSFFPMTER